MDPERLIKIAKIPTGIPKRFMTSIYDELWAYWRKNCANVKDYTSLDETVAAIKERQKGWCSIADVEAAGFTDNGRPMVPEAIVHEVVTRIVNSELPC